MIAGLVFKPPLYHRIHIPSVRLGDHEPRSRLATYLLGPLDPSLPLAPPPNTLLVNSTCVYSLLYLYEKCFVRLTYSI